MIVQITFVMYEYTPCNKISPSWEQKIAGFLLWLAGSRLEPRYHSRYTAAHQHVLSIQCTALLIY